MKSVKVTEAEQAEFVEIATKHKVFDRLAHDDLFSTYMNVRDNRAVLVPADSAVHNEIIELARKHYSKSHADMRQVGGDHYKKLQVQPWDAMEAWLTPEEFRGFLKGNIIKYLARANSDKEPHDVMVAKAEHYQQKLAEVLKKQAAEPADNKTAS